MSATVRSRTAARGWATLASNALIDLCNSEPLDLFALQAACDEFNGRLNNQDYAQSNVEIEIDEDALEADIEEAAHFCDRVREPRVRAAKLIFDKQQHALKEKETVNMSVASSQSGTGAVNARLPKIQLPSFSGDVKQWTSFWEQFLVIVHETDLPEITKFTYLKSVLKGDKLSVEGLALTSANYTVAMNILESRFGRTEHIITSHIEELLNINVPKQPKVSVLWELYDKLQTHMRSLEALGISGKQYDLVLTPLILSHLPPELRMEWARGSEEREGDLEWLLTFLHGEIARRERSQSVMRQELASGGAQFDAKGGTRVATAAALPAVDNDACKMCGRKGHTVDRCYNLTQVPPNERKSVLRSHYLCFKCLSNNKGHNFRNCGAKCSKYKGSHHVVLCKPVTAGQPGNSPTTTKHTQLTHNSHSSTHAHTNIWTK